MAFSSLTISAYAQSIVSYAFDSGDPAATTSDSNLTAGDFAFGPSFGAGFSGSGNIFARSSITDGTDKATAIAADDYLTVTVTPNAGYQMNLSSLSIDLAGSFNMNGGQYDVGFVIMSSIAGFGAADSEIGVYNKTVTDGALSFDTINFDLSGAEFQNIASSVEFRIYIFDDSSLTGNITRVDNYDLSGTVSVIPEPSVYAFMAVPVLLALAYKRRLTKNKI